MFADDLTVINITLCNYILMFFFFFKENAINLEYNDFVILGNSWQKYTYIDIECIIIVTRMPKINARLFNRCNNYYLYKNRKS